MESVSVVASGRSADELIWIALMALRNTAFPTAVVNFHDKSLQNLTDLTVIPPNNIQSWASVLLQDWQSPSLPWLSVNTSATLISKLWRLQCQKKNVRVQQPSYFLLCSQSCKICSVKHAEQMSSVMHVHKSFLPPTDVRCSRTWTSEIEC